MKRSNLAWLLLPALVALAPPVHAQGQGESLSAWKYYANIQERGQRDARLEQAKNSKYFAFTLPPEVLGKAQPRLSDLRLVDANGRFVPYALRERRTRQELKTLDAEQFDKGTNAEQRYAQVSLRLPQKERLEHNEIEVVTSGQNFRRRVVVSVSGKETFPAEDTHEILDRFLIQYDSDAGPVQVRKLKYPVQQARFLRVRVYATGEEKLPKIEEVFVRQTLSVSGVEQTLPAELGPRQAVKAEGGPGSAWFVTLHEDAVPVERLTFRVAGTAVNRPFRLESANPDAPIREARAAQWHWRKDGDQLLLEFEFAEEWASRLRLVVTDFANPPLEIQSVTYSAAARQLIFAAPADKKLDGPMKLYFGNPDATAANYDFERDLPNELLPAPATVAVGQRQDNPDYAPPPATLGERLPWLIYAVLSAACLVLVSLLALLARNAVRGHDAAKVTA